MVSYHIGPEEREQDARTFAPAIVAVGMVLFSVAITVAPRWTWAPALLVVGGLLLWAREAATRRVVVARQPQVHEGHDLARWEIPTVWWYGSAGFAFAQVVFYMVALRVLHAHGLLGADAEWPAGVETLRGLHGILLTVLMLGSAGTAAWAAYEARPAGRRERVRLALTATLALGVAFLAASALQFVRLAEAGVVAAGDGKASAIYWMLGLHAFFTLAGLGTLGLVLVRHGAGEVPPQVAGPVAVAATWWGALAVGWILVVLTVYLHALVFPLEIV